MKSKTVTIILLMFICSVSVFAQGGQAGLSFLKLGVGARSLAMGEAAVAAANDPSATHYNPAALRLLSAPQLLIMHKEWIQGTQTEFLATSFSIESFSLGAFLNATSVPDIELRLRPGPPEGTFTARNAAIGASVAYGLDESMSIGTSVKYLYEKIFVDETFGVGVDFGALYQSPLDVTFGFSLSNLGSMGKLRNESSKLPATLRVGAARSESLESIDGIINLALDVVSVIPEKKARVHVGTEFAYEETFFARLGYMTGFETRNITAGVSIEYNFIAVDYAFIPFRLDFGTTHTFSLIIDF